MSSASSTFASGQSPTATQVNGWAQGLLGYAQVTANQGSITAVVSLTGLSVTVTVVANRRIKITGQAQFSNTVAGDGDLFNIAEGAGNLMVATGAHPLANTTFTLHSSLILTPTAGSHTYFLSAQTQTGGTATMQAASNAPAFILVEDIGAV
jgi:hypothetical protein